MISGEHALWNAGIAHLRHERHERIRQLFAEWGQERRIAYRFDMDLRFGLCRNRMHSILTGITS